jgi:predicted GIY-YIG superfamily endonuclease
MTEKEFDIWFERTIKKLAREDKEILIALS